MPFTVVGICMREEWNFCFYQERGIQFVIFWVWVTGDYSSSRCRWPVGNWICGLSSLLSSGLTVGLGERRKDCRIEIQHLQYTQNWMFKLLIVNYVVQFCKESCYSLNISRFTVWQDFSTLFSLEWYIVLREMEVNLDF